MKKSLFTRIVFQVHLWGGLSLGIYALLIGITGSVLVFHEELVHAIAPDPVDTAGASPAPMETIRAGIVAAHPGWNVWSFEAPDEPGKPWSGYVMQKGQGKLVFADSRGKPLGERNLKGTWLELFGRFHSNLLIPRSGRWYNGVFGLILGALAISGLILWWPRAGEWKNAFRMIRTSNFKGIVYDLHRVGGAIVFAFVLLSCVTGAYFTWPAVYRNIAASIFPVKPKPAPATVTTQGTRLPIDDLVASARRAVPDARLVRVLVPGNNKEAVTVMLGHGNKRALSQLRVNPHTGQVLSIDDYRERRTGDNVVAWMGPLHTGHFGNLAVKILWAVLGMTIPLLFITGFIMWCNRLVGPWMKRRSRNSVPEPALVRK